MADETRKSQRRGQRSKDQRVGKAARKLLIASLAASASVPLTDWEVLAHGNRSSHRAAAFRDWTHDQYPLMREEILRPNEKETLKLRELYNALDQLEKKKGVGIRETTEYRQLREQIRSIEGSLRVQPLSSQIMQFLQQGDKAAVLATFKGIGPTDDILDAYTWTLMDVARAAGRPDFKSSSEALPMVGPLSDQALQYVSEVTKTFEAREADPEGIATLVKAASLLHNIASFTIPDIGDPERSLLDTGRKAAQMEIVIRERLAQPVQLARAWIALGRHQLAIGKLEQARHSLTTSAKIAGQVNHTPSLAWATAFLAETYASEDPARARTLHKDARARAELTRNSQIDDMEWLIEYLDRESR